MPGPIPTACQRLREADEAYHALSTGTNVRSVTDDNGERVEFGIANRFGLLAYITKLQAMCPEYQALALQTAATRPVRFFYG